MKLYHHPLSSNARRATMTAALLGAPVELVLVNLPEGEQRQPAYLALNPNAKVPALVDGELKLWESAAIMIYLADKTPGQTLYPADAAARADVNRWMFWSAAHWTPQVATLNFEHLLKKRFGLGEPDPARVAAATEEMTRLAGVLDAHLATRSYVSGDGLTLADIALACPLMTTGPSRLPVTDRPHVQAWFARIQALDAWKQTQPPM